MMPHAIAMPSKPALDHHTLLVDQHPALRAESKAAWHDLRAWQDGIGTMVQATDEDLAARWECCASAANKKLHRLEALGLVELTRLGRGWRIAVRLPAAADIPPGRPRRPKAIGRRDPQRSLWQEPDAPTPRLHHPDAASPDTPRAQLQALDVSGAQLQALDVSGAQLQALDVARSCPQGEPGGETPFGMYHTDQTDDDDGVRMRLQETALRIWGQVWTHGTRPQRILDRRDQRLIYRVAWLFDQPAHREWVRLALRATHDKVAPGDTRQRDRPLGYLQAMLWQACRGGRRKFASMMQAIEVPRWALTDPRDWCVSGSSDR